MVGRKNDYGSGSVWSGQWAACSPRCSRRLWLEAYLSACAEAGGRAPSEPGRVVAVEAVGGATPGVDAETEADRELVVSERRLWVRAPEWGQAVATGGPTR
jgi:hypothetical protein